KGLSASPCAASIPFCHLPPTCVSRVQDPRIAFPCLAQTPWLSPARPSGKCAFSGDRALKNNRGHLLGSSFAPGLWGFAREPGLGCPLRQGGRHPARLGAITLF